MGPETSMEVQAKLGSDIALAFDECTPFHVDRDYTARSTERTHRWLDRCVDWRAEHAPTGSSSTGSCRAARTTTCATSPPSGSPSTPGLDGIAVGGSLGQEKEQMHAIVERSLRPAPEEWPRHLLGIGDVDDILAAVKARHRHVRLRHADPPRPPRHGAGTRSRTSAGGTSCARGCMARSEPIAAGCPCPACRDHTRGYINYLVRENELTGARLVTLHNLTFMALLMDGIRDAITRGGLDAYADRVMRGDAPYSEWSWMNCWSCSAWPLTSPSRIWSASEPRPSAR